MTDPTPPPTAIIPASSPEEKRLAKRAPDPDEGEVINAFASENNFAGAQRMAAALSESTMVPEAYRKSIPNCLIAIEAASRIRVSVLAVMQNMDVIYGRPSWRATFLIATVNSGRRFTPIRFRWFGRMNDKGDMGWGCRAVAKDRETGEECVGTLITIGMAHSEGWWERKGSKWPTMPEQMLMYRAAAFWARVFDPEGTLGFHTTDELEDTRDAIDVDVVPMAAMPGVDRQGTRVDLRRKPQPKEEQAAVPGADQQGQRVDLGVKTTSGPAASTEGAKQEVPAATVQPTAVVTPSTTEAKKGGAQISFGVEKDPDRAAAEPTPEEMERLKGGKP